MFKLMLEYDVKNLFDLYAINSKKLKKIAEEHYKDAAKNIFCVTAEEDFLYNLTRSVRGFIHDIINLLIQ